MRFYLKEFEGFNLTHECTKHAMLGLIDLLFLKNTQFPPTIDAIF